VLNILKTSLTVAAAAAALAFAAPSFATDYPDGGVTANDVANELIAAGQKAKVSTSSSGNPMIDATFTLNKTDIDYRIFFYGCNSDAVKRCTSIQYHVAFDGKPDKVSGWNKDNRFARAYAEGNTVHLEYDVDLEKGANSKAIQNTASRWIAVMILGVTYAG
jgi:hypothetical protein